MCFSMGAVGDGVYRVFLQSKLSVVVVMMKYVKGINQSDLQWYVLLAVTTAGFAVVFMESGGDGSGALPMWGG